MRLRDVLVEIHPDWYRTPDTHSSDAGAIDAELLAHAHDSGLGLRLLARWLLADLGSELLAPRPDGAMAAPVTRWPRARLASLLRDLGALAFAPAIRAEVRREPVRQLKHALGNSYLLALDKQVWDGRVDAATTARLQAELNPVLAPGQGDDAIHALLDRRGRSELHAWALQRDQALGDWAALQYPPEPWLEPHLPEKQVVFLHDHHLSRARLS